MIVLQGHKDRVELVRFSPDGTSVLAPTWQGIQLWRSFAEAGTPVVLNAQHTTQFQFIPDGQTLFAANDNLWKFDLRSGEKTAVPLWEGTGAFFTLSSQGNRLIIGRNGFHGYRMAAHTTGGIILWERSVNHWWWLHPIFVSGDEEFIRMESEAGAPSNSTYRFVRYATADGVEISKSQPLACRVDGWILSPDSSLVACRYAVRVHIYPLREPVNKPLATIRNSNRKEFTGLAFHPSGRYLAATSNDETVKLYDTTTWEVAKTYTWNIGRMRSIAFSPDGTLAAAGSDTGKVVVWDVDL
jgi:WD40 repeat protein